MKYYIEITLIDNSEFSLFKLWSKLYTQLHLALVEQQSSDKTLDIGVSFPEYHCHDKEGKTIAFLGGKLRVFANNQAALEQLNLARWFSWLADYVHTTSIKEVPSDVDEYLQVARYRPNMNMERLTRRLAKRKGISFDEAKKQQNQSYADEKGVSLEEAMTHYLNPTIKDLPYIKMKSLSGDREFSLLIKQQPVEQPQEGSFSTYGLSSKATVPNW